MVLDLLRPPQKTVIAPQTDDGNLTLSDMLTIDCTTSESPVDEATPTKLAVEEGADITDHVQLTGVRLSLGIVHTNHPAEILGLTASSSRSRDVYETLYRWQQTKLLLTIITVHRVYENMILSSIPPTWDKDNAESFIGTLSFEEIIRVETEVVDLAQPANPSGSGKRNLGNKKGKTASPASKESALFFLKSMAVK